ncbi:MAG: hypothetical protein LUD84_08205, partial [Clostridiales bacterium]|nr:hypothetical protein [Clostridiales bacterium]
SKFANLPTKSSFNQRFLKIAIIPALFFMGSLPGWVQWILIILVIAAVVFYKKHRGAYVEEQVEHIKSVDLPDVEARIAQGNQQIESLQPWLYEVQSLMTEEMTSLDCVRGIRTQLMRGAPNWFAALQAYQAALDGQARAKREEQHYQYIEEQARQMAANSAKAAKDAAAAKELAEQAKKDRETKSSSDGCPYCGSSRIAFVQSYYDPVYERWYMPHWKCATLEVL